MNIDPLDYFAGVYLAGVPNLVVSEVRLAEYVKAAYAFAARVVALSQDAKK